MFELMGVPVFADPTMVRRVEKRVRGGYLNRWLVRAIIEEPLTTFRVTHNPRTLAIASITCHPAALAQFKRLEPQPRNPWLTA